MRVLGRWREAVLASVRIQWVSSCVAQPAKVDAGKRLHNGGKGFGLLMWAFPPIGEVMVKRVFLSTLFDPQHTHNNGDSAMMHEWPWKHCLKHPAFAGTRVRGSHSHVPRHRHPAATLIRHRCIFFSKCGASTPDFLSIDIKSYPKKPQVILKN